MGHTVPKLLVTFAAGGVGYCALETLWRGRTHPSMALCGGTWPSLTRGERGDYNKNIPYCAAQGGIGPSCGKRGENPPQQPLL